MAVWRLRGWQAAVAASAFVLLIAGACLGIGWAVSDTEHTATSVVTAPTTSIELNVGSGNAEVFGGNPVDIKVERIDDYSFGRSAHAAQSFDGSVLRLSSACPKIVIGSCSSSYRLTVPDDVAVNVHTTSGVVHFSNFRGSAQIHTTSGDVKVDAYCGFSLSATSHSGSIHVGAACAPMRLGLLSNDGSVTALVPPGPYRVRATSGSGTPHVSGVVRDPSAAFSIDAFSHSGDVSVIGGL